jgi:hypothetical protein
MNSHMTHTLIRSTRRPLPEGYARIVFDLPGGREPEPTIKVRGLEIVGLQYDLPTASCPGLSLDLVHDAGAQTVPAHICGHDELAGV